MRPQPKRMVALYDYDPAELSPNPDPFSELAFSTGDVIYVYGDMDEDGFFFGELRGQQGLVPSNFLTEAPPDYATNDGSGQRGPSRHGSLQQQHKDLRGEPSMGGGGPRGGGGGVHQSQGVHGGGGGGSQRSHSSAPSHQAPGSAGRHGPPPEDHWSSQQQQHHHHQQHQQHQQQHQQQHAYQQSHQQRGLGSGGGSLEPSHYEHRSPHEQRAASYASRPVVGTAQRW